MHNIKKIFAYDQSKILYHNKKAGIVVSVWQGRSLLFDLDLSNPLSLQGDLKPAARADGQGVPRDKKMAIKWASKKIRERLQSTTDHAEKVKKQLEVINDSIESWNNLLNRLQSP